METINTNARQVKRRRTDHASLQLLKVPPSERDVREALKTIKSVLGCESDKRVWKAVQSLRRKKVIVDQMPPLARIDQELVNLGFEPLGIKIISKSLSRIEAKGYFRRVVEFAA